MPYVGPVSERTLYLFNEGFLIILEGTPFIFEGIFNIC
jgi:hypothetical protein